VGPFADLLGLRRSLMEDKVNYISAVSQGLVGAEAWVVARSLGCRCEVTAPPMA
jgi:hypothetical protein